jgi:HEAT repeat protein
VVTISELLKKLDAVDYQLDRLSGDDVGELRQALSSEDPFLRDEVAQVLVDMIGEPAKPVLLDTLRSESWQARYVAAEKLGMLGDITVVPALIETLRDTDKMVYEAAVYALVELAEIGHSPELFEALNDGDKNVRRGAAYALGEKGGIAVISGLFECVRQGGIGGDVSDFERISGVMMALGNPAVPELIRALQDDNALLRSFAAETLGNFDDPEVIPHLSRALNDAEEDVQYHAIWALSAFGDKSVPILTNVLVHPSSEETRLSAVNVLTHIDTPEALAAVEQWRRDQGGQQA